ncbi:UNVERIFIED_CONTAM: Actin-binding Rho-activating protein, partial [Eudyptes robustus]
KKNPFSNTYEQQQYDKSASDYGRPTKGSLTEKRGIKAGNYILNQVLHLCEIIHKYGEGPLESRTIKFGYLFKLYEFYSDKVVGLLIRARKYKLLTFDGEMLYQRQDDHKPIVML